MTASLWRTAKKLRDHRIKDQDIQGEIRSLMDLAPLKDLAQETGLTAAFLCDVRKGRRAVTDALLSKIVGAGS